MKRQLMTGLVFCLGLLLFGGCGRTGGEKGNNSDISVPADLNRPGMVIGVPQGAAAMTVGEKFFDKAEIQYFNSLTDGYMAVQQKKIDAFIFDRHSMEYVVKVNPALVLLPDDIGEEHIVIGAPKGHEKLIGEVNAFIRQYLSDGTQKDMYQRWFAKKHSPMPAIPVPKTPTRKLTVGTEGLNVPMNFFSKDGEVTGYDIELIKRLALFLNADLKIVTMSFDALIPAVETGKLDLLIANLNATSERKEKLLMSKDYVDSAICVMVHKDRYAGEKRNADEIRTVQDLAGRKVACLTGSAFPQLTEPLVKDVKYQYYNDNILSVQALRTGKVDAVLFDEPIARLFASSFADEIKVACVYAEDHYGFACRKGSPMAEKAGAVIRQMKNSGEMKKLKDKWCGADKSRKVLEKWTHRQDYSGKNGVLRFAADPVQEPMCYMGDDEELIGLELDVMHRIAYDLDMRLVVIPMNFGSLIESLLSGRADMVGGSMSITEDRKEKVDFADAHYDGGLTILVRKSQVQQGAELPEKGGICSVHDLAGRNVACLTGSAFPQLTEPLVKGVKYQFYNDNTLSVQALRSRRVDAVLFDEPIAQLFASSFADEVAVACVYAEDHYGFACQKGSPMVEKASAVIRQMKNSGEMKKLKDKWCGADKSRKVLEKWTHRKDYSGKNGVLRFAADPVQEPMCYMGDDEKLIGLEMDVMHRVAYDLDMKLEVIPMNFGSLIEALLSGRADMVGGSMSITEDRKEKVDFAEAHYDGGLTILVRKPKTAKMTEEITSFSQLYGKRIGVLTGTSMDRVARSFFPSSKPVFFNAFADMPAALKAGKIEGFLNEEPQARLMIRKIPGLRILPRKLSSDDYAFMFSPKEQELCRAFNVELRKMKKDGTLKKLDEKWFSGRSDQEMPPAIVNPPKGLIRFATVPQSEPFSFLRNGQVVGYDIEIANLIAAKLGYGLKPMIVEWGGYVETVASGKARFGVGCTTVTEERKQQVLFSEPDYQGGVVVVVADLPEVQKAPGFRERLAVFGKGLKTSFERTFVREQRWKLILDGLKVTVLITVLSAILGTVLAFGVCAMRRAKNGFVSGIAHAYVALMQGMPILVILMILYYVIFAKVDISAIVVAVIGFAMNFAAYTGEMFRTGINGIPRGQTEAALALGFTRWAAFRKVILPQVLRSILPIYRGEFVSMLKMTSIVGYIAIQDLTKMSDIIRSRTYEAFFPLIVTALIYFISAHLLAAILSWLEYRLDPLNRRHAVKGENI